jgi:hypothetical protein
MNYISLRPGIAMIELVFAIVIMAIVLMSAPLLISTATKSGFVSIQQEAINEASTHMSIIMGYHWDENDTDESFIDPILYTSNGDSNLSEFNNTGRRIGTPLTSKRSFIRADGSTLWATVALGMDTNDVNNTDDIDDFIGNHTLTFIDSNQNNVDYVETSTINISTAVSYIADTLSTASGDTYADPGTDEALTFSPNLSSTSTPSTNIKKILVTLTSTSTANELNKSIELKAFSCNIGAYEFEKRDF